MTELVILVAIIVGAALFGGGIVVGVRLNDIALNGWPKPVPKPVATNGHATVAPQEAPPSYPTPPYRPPPAQESKFRYGGNTELESSENFFKLQERLRAQEAGGPYSEMYGDGGGL